MTASSYAQNTLERFNGRISKASERPVAHALALAIRAHEGQRRKYTLEPYVEHPVAVAEQIIDVFPDINAICAALLHDVVEDTDMTLEEISASGLGEPVASLVSDLTDVSRPEDGNRAHRKRLDREHLAKADPRAKLVKLADLMDNTLSITANDPKFAVTYLAEKRLLLDEALTNDSPPGSPLHLAHESLSEQASALLEHSLAELLEPKETPSGPSP